MGRVCVVSCQLPMGCEALASDQGAVQSYTSSVCLVGGYWYPETRRSNVTRV